MEKRQARFTTKRDFVFEVLREKILSGELGAGQRLRQEEVATELGISQTPVREALRRLEAEGFLTHVPHKGVRVAELSVSDVQEVYLIRSALEGLATRLAVERLEGVEQTRLVQRLEQLQARMEQCIERSNFKQLFDLNRDFHFSIYKAAGAERLYGMIQNLWDHLPHDTFVLIPGRPQRTVQHRDIIAAVRAGNSGLSTRLMTEHIESALSSLIDYIEQGDKTSEP